MKINYSSVPQLPKINIKRFDLTKKLYSTSNIHQQISQKQSPALKTINKIYVNDKYIKKQYSVNHPFVSQKQVNKLNESKLKIQYRSKSVHYFKSLLLNKHQIQNEQNIEVKANYKEIDKKSILSKIPKLNNMKSQQKIKILKQTKYEDWFPKKNKLREIQSRRKTNSQKLKLFQKSFFGKIRSKQSILKLSQNQLILT